MTKYFIRPLMEDERKYTFRSCSDIEVRSGLIGYMRVDLSTSFTDAVKTWCSVIDRLETDLFTSEFSEILNVIGLTLPSRKSLRVYYNTHYSLTFSNSDGNSYIGMMISTNKYCYLLRINPSCDTDNVIIFCYLAERLKSHIRNAAKGIRFVDTGNHELFTIRDGHEITVTPCTIKSPIKCRYIDQFSCQIGAKVWNLKDLAVHLLNAGKIIAPF